MADDSGASASASGRPRRDTADYSLGVYDSRCFVAKSGWNGAGRNKDFYYPRDDERPSTKTVVTNTLKGKGDDVGAFLATSLGQYERKAMTDKTTTDMLLYAETHRNKQTEAHFSVFVDEEYTEPEDKKGLKALGVSRNHILADSSIASIVHESAYQAFSTGFSDEQDGAMRGFFNSLAGDDHDAADAAYGAFAGALSADTERERSRLLHNSIHSVSLSMGNLRFGQAEMNTDIGGYFDPNVNRDGSMTRRTSAIREATIGLANTKIIGGETAYMSVSAPMDKRSGTLVNSSSVVGHEDER